jgi:F-type H+-transporting ATPase subunit b
MTGNVWVVATAATEAIEASEQHGFGLNFDILEANLVNLLIVIGLLVYFGRGFLGKILTDRRTSIEAAIQEAEQRKQQAAAALAEQQQNLAQAQAEAERIRAAAVENAAVAKAEIMAQAEQDIGRMRATVSQDVSAEEARIMAELRQRIAALAVEKVEAELPARLNDELQQRLVDRSIAALGGDS